MFTERRLAEHASTQFLESLKTSGLNFTATTTPFSLKIKILNTFMDDWSKIAGLPPTPIQTCEIPPPLDKNAGLPPTPTQTCEIPPLLPAPNLSAESREFELLEKEKLILKLQDEKAISKSDISVLEAKTLSLGISLKTEKAKTLSLEKSLLAENAKIISLEKSLLAEKAKFSDSVKIESNNLRCKIHEKGVEISSLKKSLEALKSEVTGHKLVSEIQGSENSKLKFQTKTLQNTIKTLENTNKKITLKRKEAEDNLSMAESKVLSLKESSNPTRPAIPKISAQQTNLPPKKAQVKVF